MDSLPINNEKRYLFVLKWVSIICFIIAAVLAVLTVFMELPQVQHGLKSLNEWFDSVERYIGTLNKFAAFTFIIFSFLVKAFIPFLPFSVLFIASGLVFFPAEAWIINILGFTMLVDIKFLWGRRRGGGGAHRLLNKNRLIRDIMKLGGEGNKLILAVLRFIPFVPVGTVSRIYGATGMNLLSFTLFSVLGYLPRLILWSQVGSNFTNPFTFSFTAPLIILFIISGLAIMLLRKLLLLIGRSESHSES